MRRSSPRVGVSVDDGRGTRRRRDTCRDRSVAMAPGAAKGADERAGETGGVRHRGAQESCEATTCFARGVIAVSPPRPNPQRWSPLVGVLSVVRPTNKPDRPRRSRPYLRASAQRSRQRLSANPCKQRGCKARRTAYPTNIKRKTMVSAKVGTWKARVQVSKAEDGGYQGRKAVSRKGDFSALDDREARDRPEWDQPPERNWLGDIKGFLDAVESLSKCYGFGLVSALFGGVVGFLLCLLPWTDYSGDEPRTSSRDAEAAESSNPSQKRPHNSLNILTGYNVLTYIVLCHLISVNGAIHVALICNTWTPAPLDEPHCESRMRRESQVILSSKLTQLLHCVTRQTGGPTVSAGPSSRTISRAT